VLGASTLPPIRLGVGTRRPLERFDPAVVPSRHTLHAWQSHFLSLGWVQASMHLRRGQGALLLVWGRAYGGGMGRVSVGWVVLRRRMHRTCALWLGLVALLILAWG